VSANWRQNGNWPNRLKDWEQRGAGPRPGEGLWDRIEGNLPPRKLKRVFPVWWLLLLGGLLGVVLTVWPRGNEAPATENGGNYSAEQVSRASANPVSPAHFPPQEMADQLVDIPGLPVSDEPAGASGGVETMAPRGESTTAAVELAGNDASVGSASRSSGRAGVAPLELRSEVGKMDTAAGKTRAPALRGPKKYSASAASLSDETGEVPSVYPSASAGDESVRKKPRSPSRGVEIPQLPSGPAEKLFTSFPVINPPVFPAKEIVPARAKAPLMVQLSGGLLRMRTEVKTPVGVELSPVDRGKRFETGNGSFLALGLQKGRVGLSTGYREQPQRNEYFTRRQLDFDRSMEEDAPDGSRTSTYELEAKDGFSESTLEIEVKRSDGSRVNERDVLRVEVRTDQYLDVRTIPLMVTYEQPIGRLLALRVGAGLSYNELRLLQSRTLTRVQLGNGLILDRNRLLRGQSTTRRYDYWGLQTQAGLFLAPRNFPLSLGVGVDLSRSLGDWRPNRPDGRWLETRGFNLTAGFRF
jgi:hypothetical protein